MRLYLILAVILLAGCKKFLTIPLPVNQIAGEGAFLSDNSAGAVATGNLTTTYTKAVFSGGESVPYRASIYMDELKNLFTTNQQTQAFYVNDLQSFNIVQWGKIYSIVFAINTTIEGINASPAVLENRNQWLGESYFLRAWMYFHLVNLFGDVPLAITSDFKVNNELARAPQADVYKQIIADLLKAQSLLSDDYRDGYGFSSVTRTRPNKGAATALLARAYLYTKDYTNAAAQATAVINQSDVYQLEGLDSTFLIGSRESLWEIPYVIVSSPTVATTYEFVLFNNRITPNIPAGVTPFKYGLSVIMSNDLKNAFETGDNRFAKWVLPVVSAATDTSAAVTYYLPYKYKAPLSGTENSVQMRFSELYLIRAEARAQLGDIGNAQSDIDVVRGRAGLGGTAAATKEALVDAVLQERRVELFTEGSHRFFDLKRTAKIDEVMTVSAAAKGGVWKTEKQLWPINTADILTDPKLKQNPGYQ
jgi:hypothetical protein